MSNSACNKTIVVASFARHFAAVLVALALLLPTLAAAQQKAASADPARMQAARELFAAMGSTAQFNTAIDTMTEGMSRMFAQQRPAQAKEIAEVFEAMRQKFKSRSEEVIAMVAPLWADKFTVDEMQQITDFFRSPIGQKLVARQPEIMQQSMQLGMAWGQRVGREVEAEARRELKRRGIEL